MPCATSRWLSGVGCPLTHSQARGYFAFGAGPRAFLARDREHLEAAYRLPRQSRVQRLPGHLPRRRDLRHRPAITDDRQHRLVSLLSHAHLPHQGSVKDQPKPKRQPSAELIQHVSGAAGAWTLDRRIMRTFRARSGCDEGSDSVAAQCGCFTVGSVVVAACVPQMRHDLPAGPAVAVSRLVRRRASAARLEATT